MKHYRFNTSIIICAALIICAASCRSRPATRAQVVRYPVKYKIDGNFEDWKTYGIGQTAKELDWNSMVITPPHEGFIIKEFYFDNDDKYLYLFFKCKPTIAELYAKTGKTYSLDDIYIDSDLNPRTGCGDRDSLGYSVLPGADTKIEIPTHILFDWTDNVRGPYSELYVYYEIKHWDSTKSQFSKEIRTEDSRNGSPLIAHGKDGVEMAILLDDLHLTKGSKFLITYNEFLVPSVCVNWSLIEIK